MRRTWPGSSHRTSPRSWSLCNPACLILSSGIYEFVRRVLVRLDSGQLGKSDKGLVRRYLTKVTGRSRAPLTRRTGQHRETGRIEDRRGGASAHPFERRSTRADIRRLGVVDAAMGQWSGPATRALMRRQYEMNRPGFPGDYTR